MKIVIAPDSFKGALDAPQVAGAIASGLWRVWPDADCVLLPVADGGEGTAEALRAATSGTAIPVNVAGPLGERITARWALLGDKRTAVIELAEAAGLTRIPPERRDPRRTTTLGVGELILSAATFPGVRRVIVGLGGSATNDGGAGILQALGVRLRDSDGSETAPGGLALADLATVDMASLRLDPASVELLIACDVDNPLFGPRGASAVFGPQKGASPADITLLDAALTRYASVLGQATGRADVAAIPGAGAAGGAAAGLLYLFPQASLRPGIDLVLDAVGFDSHAANADLILTGEGRLDAQTLGGKAMAGVARRAKAAGNGVPVGAIVGGVAGDLDGALLAAHLGVDAVMPLPPGPCALDVSMANTAAWLADAAERAARWMRLGNGLRG